MSETETEKVAKRLPYAIVTALTTFAFALGGGTGTALTQMTAPDLELVKRQAIEEALDKARKERQAEQNKEREWLNLKFESLEQKLGGISKHVGGQ